ncbi:MAG: TauD/TfdA family dioxygenase [Gammaproteobacteria bacterium]|nr:TauD/TfdA family dioxygenase [Gammaproteobacteria bacterium]
MSQDVFDLVDDSAYQRWRSEKLDHYPGDAGVLMVALQSAEPSRDELLQLAAHCDRANMAFYRLPAGDAGDKSFLRQIAAGLGLQQLDDNLCADEDSITSLQVVDSGRHAGYIPYSNKPLSWHTDGYYNSPGQQIHAIAMHCVRPAAKGGENLLLDHEIAYIQLRDENPDYIRALQRANAMTIPANIEAGKMIRPAETGPVFSLEKHGGHLHMRYSARTRNIEWFDDVLTREAVDCLNSLLSENNPYVFRYRLNTGEGIICNNVLHNRSGFTDADDEDLKRLLYRARYFDRVKRPSGW